MPRSQISRGSLWGAGDELIMEGPESDVIVRAGPTGEQVMRWRAQQGYHLNPKKNLSILKKWIDAKHPHPVCPTLT